MALQKKYISSFAEKVKAISEEICWYSNKTRESCCCHLCLRILKKICVHQRHFSLQTDNRETIKDNDNFFMSLPLSAPSSQCCEKSTARENQKSPHKSRLRIVRSKSLEDFDAMNRHQTDCIEILNYGELLQSREKKNSQHSSSQFSDQPSTHQTLKTKFKHSASVGSDSNDTLPDTYLISSSEDENEEKPLPKLVENIQCKKELDVSNDLDVSNESIEIKQETLSDEDEYSEALFNYSQEDEVILIYDSDEQDDNKSSESSKNAGQIPLFGNLEDEDTQPCSDSNDETNEDQQQIQRLWNNDQTEKTFAISQPGKKLEVPLLSKSPKFKKNNSDNLTRESFVNCQNLVKDIKQEQKSDSDDSEDLFRDEIDSQATQLYTEIEWEHVDIKKEPDVEKPYPLRRTLYQDSVGHKNADSIKMTKKKEKEKISLSPSDDGGLNESLADDGNRGVRMKKDLAPKDLEDDDDFLCSTQIDSPMDSARLIKKNTTSEEKSKKSKRWKTSPTFYDEVNSDDDDDDNLFWCATQVDSNETEKIPNKETFTLADSDEDDIDNNSLYMMATQVDMQLDLPSRGSQSSNTFKLPDFPQAKLLKNSHKNDKRSWLPNFSGFAEEDSDSDESMFSVATQVDDPDVLNKYEDEQAYIAQTQVDLLTPPKHKSGKTSTSQSSHSNAKKRKLKHKRDSSNKFFRDLPETGANSDSDDSVFSLATQIDNNDMNDDALFMAATQVDPEPLRNFKVPLTLKKHKKSFLKAEENYDSDDSVYSIATQVDTESTSNNKVSKLRLDDYKSLNKKTPKSTYVADEDYDSDCSIYSVATQVDTKGSKRKVDQKDEEEEDDMSYFVATQVDDDIDRSVKKTKPTSAKDDVFKFPSFPKKRLKTSSPCQKDSKTTSAHKQSGKTAIDTESVDSNPFSNFLLGIAEGEMEKEIILISPEKKVDADNSEDTADTEKEYGQFLLDLTDVPEQSKPKSKPISQTCPVEPLRLRTKKEMREAFKNQTIKDASNKILSPERKSNQEIAPKVQSLSDTWLPRVKKPIQKPKKPKEPKVGNSQGISKAKNQMEERYYLSHLDTGSVGWSKGSHIHYGSSPTIADVELPGEDEIRKKGLPLTEGPQRRRPLPETPIDHLPKELELNSCNSTVETPTTSTEQKKSPLKSSICTRTNPIRKTPAGPVSTHFYRESGLDTFKIPKLPNSKAKPHCNSVRFKLDEQQVSPSEKPPSRPKTELIAEQVHLIQKIIDNKMTMNRPPRATGSSLGYQAKPPGKQAFSSSDSSSTVVNQKTNYPSRAVATTSSFDSRNQYLQDRRIHSKNNRNLILKHILKWNPKWLTEQKNVKTIPPIVKMDQLLPLLNSYTSLEDYQSIFTPLLLLEIWESISKDFSENCSKNRQWQIAYSNVQAMNSYLMDYIVYGVISVQNYSGKKQMMEGDLVKMNLQVQNPQSGHNKAESIQSYPVIGVVESIRFYDPQTHSDILTRFPRLESLSEVKSKFKLFRAIIKTHYRKLSHAFNDLMVVELISSLVPQLRQFQALMALSSSLLSPYILNPGRGESAASGVDIPSTKKYNSSQMKAIAAAAYIVRQPSNQPSYCLIQGPPGTGKSHTIIGIIHKIKEINKNCKVLLCAPSNGAIDELTRRLIRERRIARAESREPLKVVRIGNPDNIHEDVSSYCLSELIKSNARADMKNCPSLYPELKRVCANENKIIRKLKDPELRQNNAAMEEQKRKLVKDLRNLQETKKSLTRQVEIAQSASEAPSLSYKHEAELRQTILLKADVICSTLNTCGSPLYLGDLNSCPFDCIIIDEASQCTELDCLIPLQYNCCKVILVGDTEQLAPTVLSQRAAEYNYGQSLLERLCNHFKDLEETTSNPVIMLNCQYRMHPEICKFSSRYIYENKLLSDTNLELRSSPINIVPYLLFDIQNGQQIRSSETGSLSNPVEAEFTVNLCEYLISLNGTNSPLAIGIIAPYKQQKNLLISQLLQRKIHKIEVTTVDGFQGREKDIIIMSCVRAQGCDGRIGFLTNRKRLNVALTRAKFALYIIGHLHSLEHADEDWKSLIQDAHQRKLVVPVSGRGSIKQAVHKCAKS